MRAFSILVAAAAGALATYFLDPEQGRRRRAETRDRLASGMRRAAGTGQTLAREPAPDEVLAERVRAAPGNSPGLQG